MNKEATDQIAKILEDEGVTAFILLFSTKDGGIGVQSSGPVASVVGLASVMSSNAKIYADKISTDLMATSLTKKMPE